MPHLAACFKYIISDSHKSPLGSVLPFLFCWWRDWGSESTSDPPRIIQPVNSSTGTWTQIWPTSKPFSSTALFSSVSNPFPDTHPSLTLTTYWVTATSLSASVHTGLLLCLGRGESLSGWSSQTLLWDPERWPPTHCPRNKPAAFLRSF